MPRPLICEVSIAAMQHNLERVRWYFNRGRNAPVGIWSVVKANAYGHGLELAVQAFSESDGLALVETDYAEKLRIMGWTKPVLLLEGPFDREDVKLARRLDLSLVIHCREQLTWLREISGEPLRIWLKFNTGMNRLGFTEADIDFLTHSLADLNVVGIGSVGMVTHFANSDVDEEQAQGACVTVVEQLERFSLIWHRLKPRVPSLRVSLSNSSAVIGYQHLHDELYPSSDGFPWLRPGVMLYGGSPYADLTAQSAKQLGLKPAMALRSKILAVQVLSQGDAIGYGSRFVAQSPMRIGVVAVGYADGYPRHAPDGTPVWVGGRRSQLVGRVSMDMMVIDITHLPNVGIGSEVELWGENLAVDEVAQACGTIGYELMCAVAPRVTRLVTTDFLSSNCE
jgi:alanine racemase